MFYKAIEIVSEFLPSLILLDVMMPGMDGYEVCKILKQNKKTKNIPVIFITARTSEEDEQKGFLAGGVDYITKPFKLAIVKARIKTHIELKHHRDRLNELVKERTGQLVHSDRLATLGTLSSVIAHEIKNPLFFISGNAEMIQNYIHQNNYSKVYEKTGHIIQGAKKIKAILDSLRTYGHREGQKKEIISLTDIVNDAETILNYRLRKGNIVVEMDETSSKLSIYGNKQELSQVFINLFVNAIDAFKPMELTTDIYQALENNEGRITITATKNGSQCQIFISDNGSGISDETKDKIFEPFITTKGSQQGTGLGLYITKHIVEEHNGTIRLSRSDETGTEFVMTLPEVSSQQEN